MAPPVGNKFWQLRHKDGRDKLFASGNLLWEASTEYFEWCDNNPLAETDWVGKDADQVERKKKRPYTLSGLCIYLGASESWWKQFRRNETLDDDFLSVIARIEDVIRTNKLEGAIVGHYNGNVVARDLGMVEKTDVTSAGQPLPAPTVIRWGDKDISV